VLPACDQFTDCAGQVAAVTAQVVADNATTPAVHVAVAVPVVGATKSLTLTADPLAPPAYDAVHELAPTVQLTDAAMQAAGKLHVPDAVATPFVQEAVAEPVVGAVTSKTVVLVPENPPGYDESQVLPLLVQEIGPDAHADPVVTTIAEVARVALDVLSRDN
jgi:hypothetical protein